MQNIALLFLFVITISLAAPFGLIFAQTSDEAMIEGSVEPPLKQLAEGTEPHAIQCADDQRLVFKASNWRPACVNESSYAILLERGWVSTHDPSYEELTQMVNDYMETLPEVTEDEIEIEEDVVLEGETNTGNETETKPQNYTVELREDMEMGAQ